MTLIFFFLLKDKFGLKEKVKSVGIENCFVSEITIAELTYGAFKSNRYEKHITEIVEVEELFNIVPIYECLKLFGKEKARLSKLGTRIPDFDLLIGVASVQRKMIMVTNNEKHLFRIEGIRIENWIKENEK